MEVSELKNSNSKKTVISNLEIARSFFERGQGLLGRSHLDPQAGLWIPRCNSIHTFFMKFSIDCIFLDKNFPLGTSFEIGKNLKLEKR